MLPIVAIMNQSKKNREYYILLLSRKKRAIKSREGMGSSISCGLARSCSLVGEKPTRVAVSHGPGIEPCRCGGNSVVDA